MKNLLLIALVFIGLNTFAQQPNHSQPVRNFPPRIAETRMPLRNQIILSRSRQRMIAIRRFRNNHICDCRKCNMIHKKHHSKNRKHNHRNLARF